VAAYCSGQACFSQVIWTVDLPTHGLRTALAASRKSNGSLSTVQSLLPLQCSYQAHWASAAASQIMAVFSYDLPWFSVMFPWKPENNHN
jgi:hypothetical protein